MNCAKVCDSLLPQLTIINQSLFLFFVLYTLNLFEWSIATLPSLQTHIYIYNIYILTTWGGIPLLSTVTLKIRFWGHSPSSTIALPTALIVGRSAQACHTSPTSALWRQEHLVRQENGLLSAEPETHAFSTAMPNAGNTKPGAPNSRQYL